MSLDASQIEAYAALLQTADAAIDRDAAVAFRRALDTLRQFAQGIEHRKTGNMAESTYTLGPFPAETGVLEGSIQSAAPYTVYEVERGGDHDWMSRTISEGGSILDALADETGRIVAAAVMGVS